MPLLVVKYWICDLLHSHCATMPQYIIMKPLYHTVCFFHKILCNNNENITKSNIYDVDLPGTISKCKLTDYISDVIDKVCTLSCNVTSGVIQIKIPPNWLHNTSARVLTQVSCTPLNNEGKCYINWCYIRDYTVYWIMELQKQWFKLIGNDIPLEWQLKPTTGRNLAEKVYSRWSKCFINWINQYLGMEWLKNVRFVQYCATGTILLLVLFLFRKRLKQKTDATTPTLEDSEESILRAVMDILSKNNYETLKKLLQEQNSLKQDQIIQNLNKNIQALQIEITEYVVKQKDIDSQFQQKWTEYETKVTSLIEQLTELQMDHSIQHQKYLSANEKISQLENLVEELKTVSRVHQNCIEIRDQQTILQEQPVTEISPKPDDQCEATEEAATAEHKDPDVIEAFKIINAVFKDTQELKKQIEVYSGSEEDKIFLHLNELLIRNTLKLDNIESKGLFDIRNKRKETLHYIQHCKRILRSKVTT